jgi:hypothetical protein
MEHLMWCDSDCLTPIQLICWQAERRKLKSTSQRCTPINQILSPSKEREIRACQSHQDRLISTRQNHFGRVPSFTLFLLANFPSHSEKNSTRSVTWRWTVAGSNGSWNCGGLWARSLASEVTVVRGLAARSPCGTDMMTINQGGTQGFLQRMCAFFSPGNHRLYKARSHIRLSINLASRTPHPHQYNRYAVQNFGGPRSEWYFFTVLQHIHGYKLELAPSELLPE